MGAVLHLSDTLADESSPRRRCATCGDEYPADFLVCPRDATPLGIDRDREDPLLGVVLGGTYRIARKLGRGGMGALYEASHTRLGRTFAIKVLHEPQSRSREARRRFEREARVLGVIRSDHVLDIVDVLTTPDGRTALVTPRLEGEDLRARLERVERLSVAEAVGIARQVCRGLAAVHAHGVIHRDLKPSNLFLAPAPDGRTVVKILDFGVAKLDDDGELTRSGTVVGTPAFMAPEQARGSASVDLRADVYAVGAVLYRMLTGRAPVEGRDPTSMLSALLHERPPRPRSLEPSIPAGLEVVIQRAMAHDLAERPESALELDRALAPFDTELEQLSGPERWAPAPSASTDVDTLVLPRGSVARAEALSRRARAIRPLAVAFGFLATALLAVVATLTTAGLQALDGLPRSESQRTAACLVFAAVAIAGGSLIARRLGQLWADGPSVAREVERARAGILGAVLAFGVFEVGARAAEALTLELEAPSAFASFVRAGLLCLGALAGVFVAHRVRSRSGSADDSAWDRKRCSGPAGA